MQNLPQDDKRPAGEQDKSRQKSDLQREAIMVESEYRKAMIEKNKLEAETRQLKKDEDRIQMSLREKKTALGKVEYDLMQLDNALKSVKKKLNSL